MNNIGAGVAVVSEEQLQVKVLPGQNLPDVVKRYNPQVTVISTTPGTLVGIVQIPKGQIAAYSAKLNNDPNVDLVFPVPITPYFSLPLYGHALHKQITQYAHGDFGTISFYGRRPLDVPVTERLPQMIARSMSYLIPALALGLVLGFVLALLGVWKPRIGKILDAIQAVLLGIPDFFLVVLLQFGAIWVDKQAGHPVIKIMQFMDQTPFLIPLVALTILPAVLVYGTMRIAFEREWEEPYVKTAYAKGLTRPMVILIHLLRNTVEDVLTILPRTVSVSVTSLVMVEVITAIFGLGGYTSAQNVDTVTSLPTTCAVLAAFALVLNGLLAAAKKRLVVSTKEGA